ncbi:FAD-dependent monooxygenase [Moorena producens]|uniref:FAD-dependent monooxygenase n=1 Tax=Moorena producens TaxID=1155739 RepID=UPI003C738F49
MKLISKPFDVVIIGAGPVGCVTAMSLANCGERVLLLEANPNGLRRMAGEWLHPPALKILQNLGMEQLISTLRANYVSGLGFVVFPDDGTEPIQLNYPNHNLGFSCEHNTLVKAFRKAILNCPNIQYIPFAKVTHIEGKKVIYYNKVINKKQSVFSENIIGADGRSSIVRKHLGILYKYHLISYMAGLFLENVTLPWEGFGHVFLGGIGPALVYRIGCNQVRICLDVPVKYFRSSRNLAAFLWDAYSPVLPKTLLSSFRYALENRSIAWCANQFSPRVCYGSKNLTLVGDATGCYHPITATGMTLGFQDAERLATSKNFQAFQRDRLIRTYVPELLALTLYQVFTRLDYGTVAIRQAVYQMWRQYPDECYRTMRLLSGEETNILSFSGSFTKGLGIAVSQLIRDKIIMNHGIENISTLAAFKEWIELPLRIALHRLSKNYH